MGDLRARTADEFQERKRAILTACEMLCADREYDQITLADIARRTSLSRPSMYNYYQRKEDVFLDLLKIKCAEWADALQAAFVEKDTLTKAEFCEMFTDILCQRELTLKLLSLNFASIEKNCSAEAILSFRQVEERIPTLLLRISRKLFPGTDEMELANFVVQIMVYIYGIYPIVHFSPKLMEVWDHQGQQVPEPDMRAVCNQGILLITDGFSCHLSAK